MKTAKQANPRYRGDYEGSDQKIFLAANEVLSCNIPGAGQFPWMTQEIVNLAYLEGWVYSPSTSYGWHRNQSASSLAFVDWAECDISYTNLSTGME